MGGLNEITDGSYSLLNVTYYNYNKPIFIKKTKTKNYINLSTKMIILVQYELQTRRREKIEGAS